MPAESKNQQKFMAMVLKCKTDGECPSAAIKKAAENMTEKEIRDFAETKHKGLPTKVAESITFREFLLNEAALKD